MEIILRETKKIAITLGITAAVLMTAGAACGVPLWRMLLSVLFGSAYTAASFVLLGTICAKACRKTPAKAKSYMQLHYFFRLLLTGVVVLASFKMPYLTPAGVIVPLFAPKLTYFAVGIWESVRGRGRERQRQHRTNA